MDALPLFVIYSEALMSVLPLPTDMGREGGASEEATPTPTSEHEDDNSLGYTGIAIECLLSNLSEFAGCISID